VSIKKRRKLNTNTLLFEEKLKKMPLKDGATIGLLALEITNCSCRIRLRKNLIPLLMVQIIKEMANTFEKIYIFTRLMEPIYEWLQEQLGQRQLEVYEGLDYFNGMDLNKDFLECQTLVIFDDLVLEKDQTKIGEIIIILHDAPKHPKLVWPKVGPETHDGHWIKTATTASENSSEIVRKIWKPEGDTLILKLIGNEICKSLSEHSLERVLYWMKWLFEEESKLKKEHKKGSLTTFDRGSKNNEVSYYLL
jgi:hypothetical protein